MKENRTPIDPAPELTGHALFWLIVLITTLCIPLILIFIRRKKKNKKE